MDLAQEPALPRTHGGAELAVKWDGARTRLAHTLEHGAAKLRFPRSDDAKRLDAVWINTGGGLTDGDRLTLEAEAGADTRLLLTTQAAEKIYRARHGMQPAASSARIGIGAGAYVEWLPQETILFDGGCLARRLDVTMPADARLLAVESVVLGRSARGEVVESGFLEDRWRIRVGGCLVWADTVRLAGAIDKLRHRRALLDGARAFASLVYVGRDADAFLEPVRAWCEALPIRAGVTRRGELLAVRCLSEDGNRLRVAMAGLLTRFRSALAGATVSLPRLWTC